MASAIIIMTWLVEVAGAQQTISGALPSPASPLCPASEESAPAQADVKYNQEGSADWRESVRIARQRHLDWLAGVAAKARNCLQDSDPDPMEPLLNDETLVNGDIVSTPNGLKIFHGRPQTPHNIADFE
jgi:hypothetical protein